MPEQTQFPQPTGAVPTRAGLWRRPLSVEDLLEIAARNKSWLAGPTLAGLVIAVVVAFLWPDTYVSRAVIRVVPPRVPAAYVPEVAVQRDTAERLDSLAQAILSRGVLRNLIETYGLYPRERRKMPIEDVIDKMRASIHISEPRLIRSRRGQSLTAVEISFAYENRHLAQRVTEELAARFISMSTRERSAESVMTAQFLRDQWEAAKRDLDEVQRKLTEFRVRHAGRLPDQWSANVQRLAAMETRVATLNGEISRLEQEKLVLQSRIRVLEDRISEIKRSAAGGGRAAEVDPEIQALERQLEAGEKSLLALLQVYTPSHPDVVRARAMVEAVRRQLDARRAARQQQTPEVAEEELPAAARAEIDKLQMEIRNLQIQVDAANLQVKQNLAEIDRVNQRIREIQKQLETAPVGEQEYAALLRDYQLASQRYDELNRKMAQSEMVTDLESRRQGEKLELLDPASLPERPARPIRWLIILVGVGAGFSLGVGLVVVRELRDDSLKSVREVKALTQLPILGSLPLIESDEVVQRQRRLRWLAWSTACGISVAVMLAAVYYHYATRT